MKNDVKGEGSRLSRKKKTGSHSAPRTENGSSCESLSASLGTRTGGTEQAPPPGWAPPTGAAARRRRQGSLRAAGARAGLSSLLPLAAPPAGRCRRQNQTRPSRPRPSPRAGPAAGRRAARAMVRAGARLPGPFLPAARPPKPPAAWGPGLAGSGLPGWLQGPRPPGRTPRAPRAFRPPLPRSRRLAAPGPRFMPPAPPRAA